ncbi:putative lipid II flippase FtsW [Salirhabdus salicampi]|uniref:putative lipid II flippase FtsW n=1 Tax=Salirhabdus salicampi TaxID=476102 RepID=UPI0020C24703|nr:putative lipid II flippase FtsW [Salirhabdus salicampi]MCP8616647.1 putative lipid II flippase FtsW [Salirhabdus salicampi]
MRNERKKIDFPLFMTPLLLGAFGILMVYSSSMVYAVVQLEVSSTYFLIKQLQWFCLGTVIMGIAAYFPYRKYQRLVKAMVFVMVVLLIGVLFMGKLVNNARSWFEVAGITFQPAELAKIGLIFYLASVYSKKTAYIHDFIKAVIPPLVLTSFVLMLIMKQPDIGTASIIFLIASTVIASSGIRVKHLLGLSGVATGLLLFTVPNMVTEERISRFTGAFNPFEDPSNSGFHLIQSYLAIGNGGLFGQGLGNSIQKLGFLPEPHTDFILAVIAEELGLLGVTIVIGLLAFVVVRGLYIAKKCRDPFGSLLAIGIASMIAIQTFINIGSMSGLLPITGVPLPFISYGGSSLLILMFSMGVLNNIAMEVMSYDLPMKKEVKPTPTKSKQKDVVNLHERGGKTWVN